MESYDTCLIHDLEEQHDSHGLIMEAIESHLKRIDWVGYSAMLRVKKFAELYLAAYDNRRKIWEEIVKNKSGNEGGQAN